MTETLSCPSCGAPILSPGSEPSTSCPYCSRLVLVPEAFRAPSPSGLPAEKAQEIASLIRSRQKIPAIKALREVDPRGLKEAKDAVDRTETLLARSPSATTQQIISALAGGAHPAPSVPRETNTRLASSTAFWTLLAMIAVTLVLLGLILAVIL